MKKVVSILLAALMLVSCFSMMAFAEDKSEVVETVYATVIYLVPGYGEAVEEQAGPKIVEKGKPIPAAEMEAWLLDMPREFKYNYDITEDGYTRTETRTYTFKGFSKKGDDSGILYHFGSTGDIDEDTVFIAEYKITDTVDNVTFWEFIRSIFARFNVIFEYFEAIFKF